METKTRTRKIGFSLKINTRIKDDFHVSAPELRLSTKMVTPPDSPLSATTLKNPHSPTSSVINRKLVFLEKLHRKYEDQVRRQMKGSLTEFITL